MGILSRLKRLWQLSEYNVVTPAQGNPWIEKPPSVESVEPVSKPVGQATVVEDDPLDIFPSDEQPSEKSN